MEADDEEGQREEAEIDDRTSPCDDVDEAVSEVVNSEEELIEQELNRADEAFLSNIGYVTEVNGRLVELNPAESLAAQVPKGFICFKSNERDILVKKATLIWWLGTDGKRISTDRVYKFMSDRPSSASIEQVRLYIGNYVAVDYKGVERIVQVLEFRFPQIDPMAM